MHGRDTDSDDWVSSPEDRELREQRIKAQNLFENKFYEFLGVPVEKGRYVTPIAHEKNGGDVYEVLYEGGQTYLGYKDGMIFANPQPSEEQS